MEFIMKEKLHNALKTVVRNIDNKTSSHLVRLDIFRIGVEEVGDIHFVKFIQKYNATVFDTVSKTETAVIIKKTRSFDQGKPEDLEISYLKNEISFYSIIVVALKAFEKEHQILESLIPVPEFITCDIEEGHEMLILENLFYKNFEKIRRNFDEYLCRLIFETYGQFHAVSLCWKSQKPQKFQNLLTTNLIHLSHETDYDLPYLSCLDIVLKRTFDILIQHKQNHLLNALKDYFKTFKTMFDDLNTFERENSAYSCLLHDNTSISQLMFKYNEKTFKVESIKLLGFANMSIRFGSPIRDLLNFFYSDIEKTEKHLDLFDSFLDSYYDSFSDTVKRFHQDPAELLPKEKLLEQWKVHAKCYMLKVLGLLITEIDLENLIEKTYSVVDYKIMKLLQHLYDKNLL